MTSHLNESRAVPSVSFDIELGKQLSFIDFNYDSYDKYAQARGLTDQDIEASPIEVSAIPFYSPYVGSYDLDTHTINVGVKRRNSEKRVNFIFKHELEHRIEDAAGNISEEHVIEQNKMIKRFNLAIIAAGSGFAGIFTGEVLNSEILSLGGFVTSAIGLIIAYRSGKAYETQPHEQKAFSLKNDSATFIHIER